MSYGRVALASPQELVEVEDVVESVGELMVVGRGRRESLRLVKTLRVRSSDDAKGEDDLAGFEDNDEQRIP